MKFPIIFVTEALQILGAKLKSLFVYFIMLGLKLCLQYFVVRTSSRPEVAKVRSIGENQKYQGTAIFVENFFTYSY